MVELKGYVALSPSKDTAEHLPESITRAIGFDGSPTVSNSFLAADVSLLVNMDAVNDMYGDQIRQFKGLIDFALGQAQNMGMVPGLGKKSNWKWPRP